MRFLLDVFEANKESIFLVHDNEELTYGELLSELNSVKNDFSHKFNPGEVVCLNGDFNLFSIALLLNLIDQKCAIVPMTNASINNKEDVLKISQATKYVDCFSREVTEIHNSEEPHELYKKLREESHPGLVLFSSGSTGKSKGAVHDFEALLSKFKVPKKKKNIISFLLFDHIGGLNTLFYTISNGGCLVYSKDRNVDRVCQLIEKHSVNILPTTPTFCNLMLLNEVHKKFNLNALETITYGTEVMPESTLLKMAELYPQVTLQQTYGLSEIGIMRSKSESNKSLWVKIGGEDFQTRVVDGILHVKAKSAMLGYLNAPSPFSEDGWFITGDKVEVKGDYFKILGRESEIINVGGLKVYPAEVESSILTCSEVEDVIVTKESNPILGNIVVAKIKLANGIDKEAFRPKLREFLIGKLEKYKVPSKFIFTDDNLFSARFKRGRNL